jgi:hypothetical protein
MTATAADYTWFSERFWTLTGAYCLTLVEGLSRAVDLGREAARAARPGQRGPTNRDTPGNKGPMKG